MGLLQEVFTVDNLFDKTEATAFRDYIDAALTSERRFSMADFKNGKMHHPEWASLIWERLKPSLPISLLYKDAKGQTWQLQGACDTIMYALVQPGQGFPIHTDTGCVWEEDGDVRSLFTVLIYLNDDFTGGHTLFYDDGFNLTRDIEPRQGTALVFDIESYHSGEAVTDGKKYWLGTELVAVKIQNNRGLEF